MPPPKAKLHKKTGKLKNIQSNSSNNILPDQTTSVPPLNNIVAPGQLSTVPSTSQPVNVNEGDSDADRKFELELAWCVQQIQSSLNTGKLSEKQTIESERVLKVLKSPNQPTIKKRQLMKSTFGAYRVKMLNEEKMMSLKAKQIRFYLNTATMKSYFLKKSAFTTSGSNFKFNFPIEEQIEQLNISDENGEKLKETTSNAETEFRFHPSNNSFKFNFDVNELEEFTAL